MMNKRGLSDIVATVLIILLAIAAVAIVWVVVQQMIRGTTDVMDLNERCLLATTEALSCVNSTVIADLPESKYTVTIQLRSGEAYQLVAILEDAAGQKRTQTMLAPSGVMGSTSTTINTTGGFVPIKARGGIVMKSTDTGEELVCTSTSEAINCP
jgi:hypothetical protein